MKARSSPMVETVRPLKSWPGNTSVSSARLNRRRVTESKSWPGSPSPATDAAQPPSSRASPPEIWILGSSDYGAQLAAHLGLPYAFAYFFMDGQGVEQALDLYRRLYRPSERHPTPQATICVWALAADTEADARFHALSRERWRLDRQRGVLGPLRRPDAVAAQGFGIDEQQQVDALRRKALVGTAEQVASGMRSLAAGLGLSELVVNTWAHDPLARRLSYELLAQAFGAHKAKPL